MGLGEGTNMNTRSGCSIHEHISNLIYFIYIISFALGFYFLFWPVLKGKLHGYGFEF